LQNNHYTHKIKLRRVILTDRDYNGLLRLKCSTIFQALHLCASTSTFPFWSEKEKKK